MTWKTHMPLALATTAVVAAMGVCTWSIEREIRINSSYIDSNELSAAIQSISGAVESIDRRAESIDKNTACVEYRLMSTEERFARLRTSTNGC